MPVVTKDIVPAMVATGASARVAHDVAPLFKVGDRVRAKNVNPTRHTRLPRYVRGHVGTIIIDHGVFGFPDTMAHHEGEKPQHAYAVRFRATDLWGPSASPRDSVTIDLFDDYLEPAD